MSIELNINELQGIAANELSGNQVAVETPRLTNRAMARALICVASNCPLLIDGTCTSILPDSPATINIVAAPEYKSGAKCLDTTIINGLFDDKGHLLIEFREMLERPHNNYYISRHGQSEYNLLGLHQGWMTGIDLTDLGVEQAQKIADVVREGVKIDRVFSSDLERAAQTAEIVADTIGLDVSKDSRIKDYRISESLEGLDETSVSQDTNFQEWLAKHADDRSFSLPDGESLRQFSERVIQFTRELEEKFVGENILIVAHERVVIEIIRYLTGMRVGRGGIENARLYFMPYTDGIHQLK